MEIISRLDEESCLEGLAVYVGSFLSEVTGPAEPYVIDRAGVRRIPKVIHYCWFGGGDIPEEYLGYMETWRRYCPDYEIRRWDESNFNVHGNRYMHQAYEKKKWAFVSDYARLAVIYEQGGIYLDCDVELVKSLEGLLSDRMFCGFEDQNHINLGLGFGAVKGHPYLKALMDEYDTLAFIKTDGSMDLTPCPARQTRVIQRFGIEARNNYQRSGEITAYPTEFFSPVSVWGTGKATAATCAVHHFGASWQTEEEREGTRDMYKAYQNRLSGETG
ncbi:MAG TPA: glycosyl transferase [Lachnospiraceae bacterium]|nr:glycosyl transferase [Lachnospiraceae bacterium]